MLLGLLFIIVVSGGYVTSPLPCPTPEDITNASYTGGTCSERYSCCYAESVMNPTNGNFSIMPCCYAYGSDGPYKCCGRSPDYSAFLLLLLLIPVTPAIFLIIYICCCGTKPTQNNQSVPEAVKSDESIELETITVESGSFEVLED